MKLTSKKIALAILIALIVLTVAFTVSKNYSKDSIVNSIPQNQIATSSAKASFTIITDSITRSFKAEKYHNRSIDVFIQSDNPTVVHVTKAGITWQNFFDTLPMKLTKDCLTTGDGETLCNSKDGSLKFYLNDIEDKNLLEKEIKDGDKALIKFISLKP